MEPTREINEEGRWQVGGPHSLSFQIMEEEEVSLLIQGLDSYMISMQVTQVRKESPQCLLQQIPISSI